MINNFTNQFDKYNKLVDEFQNYKQTNEQNMSEVKNKLERTQSSKNIQQQQQLSPRTNETVSELMGNFAPNQLDQFTQGLSQMKE